MNSGKLIDFFSFFFFFLRTWKTRLGIKINGPGTIPKPQGGNPLTADAPLVTLLHVELNFGILSTPKPLLWLFKKKKKVLHSLFSFFKLFTAESKEVLVAQSCPTLCDPNGL